MGSETFPSLRCKLLTEILIPAEDAKSANCKVRHCMPRFYKTSVLYFGTMNENFEFQLVVLTLMGWIESGERVDGSGAEERSESAPKCDDVNCRWMPKK